MASDKHSTSGDSMTQPARPTARQPARAATAAFIGTMIEWYDFYIYATAAALVFGELYFPSYASACCRLTRKSVCLRR
jgi:hypothetical protein